MFEHSYLLPKDEDIPIWRYMPFSKFISLLHTSTLYFSRVDKFTDQYEGHVNDYTHFLIDQLFEEFENSVEMRNQLKFLLTGMRSCTYVSCWHMNYNESQGMWDEYFFAGEGIAIESTSKRLMASIVNNELGPMHLRSIKYADTIEEEIDLSHALELLNYKQPHFSFEQELRLLLVYAKGVFDNKSDDEESEITIQVPEYGVSVPLSLDALIDAVYVSPKSPRWFYDLVKNLIDQVLNKEVLESSLK